MNMVYLSLVFPSLSIIIFQHGGRCTPMNGAQIMFGPKRKLDPKKHIFGINSVHLTDSSHYLHGAFNFESSSEIIVAKQYI